MGLAIAGVVFLVFIMMCMKAAAGPSTREIRAQQREARLQAQEARLQAKARSKGIL